MIKSFNAVLCASIAVVLFSSTVSFALSVARNCLGDHGYSISKKGALPPSSERQLPYEEKETEKDDELQDHTSMVCLVSEPLCFTPVIHPDKRCEKMDKAAPVISDIPLYLTKRVFLI